jgi:hypothetical protein
LTKARRCAWSGFEEQQTTQPVWVRGEALAFRCPKSIVTAQSLHFIEQFLFWKRGGGDLWSLEAKSADALLVLQDASVKESQNEEN